MQTQEICMKEVLERNIDLNQFPQICLLIDLVHFI